MNDSAEIVDEWIMSRTLFE